MVNYWSQACTTQFNDTLPQLQQANHGSGIFAVRALLRYCCARVASTANRSCSCAVQVASCGFAAAFSGMWFALWVRLQVRMRREGFLGPLVDPEATRRRDGGMWVQLGWFSGLMCAGGVAGAVAWGAIMQARGFQYESTAQGVTRFQFYALSVSSHRWEAVYLIFYPVEFLCLITAKLILLGRLSNHASHHYNSQAWHMDDRVGACDCIGEYALEKLHRVISAAVVVCSVVCMLAFFVADAYKIKAVGLFDQAAAACDAQGNDTSLSKDLRKHASNALDVEETIASVQYVLEAVVLVVMSAAYMVFIPVCVAMFGRVERRLIRVLGQIEYKLDDSIVFLPAEYNPQAADGAVADTEIRMRCDKGKELLRTTLTEAIGQRRRFVAACAIVLVTFFLRASFDFLHAYSAFNDPYNPACGICDPCQTDATLINVWLIYTPEFQSIVVALSSPLPLVISLWLMMTKEDRMQLVFSGADDHTLPLLDEQIKVIAARQNMAIDLL